MCYLRRTSEGTCQNSHFQTVVVGGLEGQSGSHLTPREQTAQAISPSSAYYKAHSSAHQLRSPKDSITSQNCATGVQTQPLPAPPLKVELETYNWVRLLEVMADACSRQGHAMLRRLCPPRALMIGLHCHASIDQCWGINSWLCTQ